ncbi:MAG: fumarylacetoacetate hydrolase family protein [Proteobacteria bacterium]|nr:fumarylacetoacetate hydrolase family protein [Pseudomonadota bacterium]
MAGQSISERALQACADRLFVARREKKPVPPLSAEFGLGDPEQAYAVQDRNTRRWLQEGRRLVGRKIGLTSRAVQQQLGVNEPDYGMLWGDMTFSEADEIAAARFMQPRVEVEIAFVMEREVTATDTSLAELIGAIAYALPAVEIVDSAIADWKITLADTIADNASGGGNLLGIHPRAVKESDLRLCGMLLTQNGRTAATGLGAACLGHPLNAVLWLARKMAEVGRPLQAGDLVLSGALGPMIAAGAGDCFTVEIQGFAPFTWRLG